MRKHAFYTFYFALLFWIIPISVIAGGVAIVDEGNKEYLRMENNTVNVRVENQVAIVTSLHTFRNIFDKQTIIKYAFPLPTGASATQLRYAINGEWKTAIITEGEQDTSIPGGGSSSQRDPQLREYLGDNPLFFSITDTLNAGDRLSIDLSYVQFLTYELGVVEFSYPNRYNLFQNEIVDSTSVQFEVLSERTIEEVSMTSHEESSRSVSQNMVSLYYERSNLLPSKNLEFRYRLSLDELGVFGLSTFKEEDESLDNFGRGFFTVVIEPDNNEVNVIDKVFTFVIDRSGSMSGNKMVQAKNVAQFIVDNLNDGDLFNIVDFSSDIKVFRNEHVLANNQNKSDALSYINGLRANGGTNISGSLTTAVQQFGVSSDDKANIIIFLTDGQATSGITQTSSILDKIRQDINDVETRLQLFTFGIGSGANRQLLTSLAAQNNGLSDFVENELLESEISNFFLKINNPVLLETKLNVQTEGVSEIYPRQRPNLYIGQQLVISGRYLNTEPINLSLSGTSFGRDVQYDFTIPVSDSSSANYQFLSKVWAKAKIDDLMIDYLQLDPNSSTAEELKQDITDISIKYGVQSSFTSFEEDDQLTDIEDELATDGWDIPKDFKLLGNYPNPFNPTTTIKFQVSSAYSGVVYLRIYNTMGQLVNVISLNVRGPGTYEVVWNGTAMDGQNLSTGVYIYIVDFGDRLLTGKMTLVK